MNPGHQAHSLVSILTELLPALHSTAPLSRKAILKECCDKQIWETSIPQNISGK